ncbi:bifunctional DNA primase/polymerase [Mesorhizobium australicum]|uniref:bifunctional DNA primase/polymerase n=1 Tax=Mesorhizobium australicum TaxID=536018 RepID=UPI00333D2025
MDYHTTSSRPASTPFKLGAALSLAKLGLYVFPLRPGEKLPAIAGWQTEATADPQRLSEFWSGDRVVIGKTRKGAAVHSNPDFNIGVACGPSGLIVLDCDIKEGIDGDANLRALAGDGNIDLCLTLTFQTPSGGRHYLFIGTAPDSVGKIAPGVDVRSRGGLIAAPGSRTERGAYKVINNLPIADAPGWLLALIEAAAAKATPASAPAYVELDTAAAVHHARQYLADEAPLAVEGSGGDATAYKVAARVRDFGISEDQAVELMREHWDYRCSPPWGDDLAEKVANVFQYGQNEAGSASVAAEFDILPDDDAAKAKTTMIRIRPGHISDTTSQAEAALIAAEAPLYIRGDRIVRPVVEDMQASNGSKTKVARLVKITPNALVDQLSRAASWTKYDKREKKWVRADPPKPVADILLERDGDWRLPNLTGVITTPTLRPDGSVLATPGYDAATRLLLLSPPAMPPVAERPTRDDAAAALALLCDLLGDFPFTDDASRSVTLSALITPVVRGVMSVAPMHVIRAPAPGSGKSYLVDLASAIATGQRAPVIAAGQSVEETEKRLGAALLAGQAIVSIDNLNGSLSGDALCQMIERPIVEIRPLGESRLARIESRATIYATGNNIAMIGDLVRRVVVCSLDANVERPELRRFGGDPFSAILADRGRFVAAALTIVRAYLAVGCPDTRAPLASFEAWSRTVRSALVWLGCADPVDTMASARADDPEWAAAREVVAAWHEVQPGRALTTRELKELIEGQADFSDSSPVKAFLAVAADRNGHGIETRKLGFWLGRHRDRIIDGKKITAAWDAKLKQQKWELNTIS